MKNLRKGKYLILSALLFTGCDYLQAVNERDTLINDMESQMGNLFEDILPTTDDLNTKPDSDSSDKEETKTGDESTTNPSDPSSNPDSGGGTEPQLNNSVKVTWYLNEYDDEKFEQVVEKGSVPKFTSNTPQFASTFFDGTSYSFVGWNRGYISDTDRQYGYDMGNYTPTNLNQVVINEDTVFSPLFTCDKPSEPTISDGYGEYRNNVMQLVKMSWSDLIKDQYIYVNNGVLSGNAEKLNTFPTILIQVHPTSVTSIAADAFKGCTSLSGVLLAGTNVSSIGSNAFSGCEHLVNLSLSNKFTTIPSNLISGTDVGKGSSDNITIPYSITSIKSNALNNFSSNNNSETITLKSSMTKREFDSISKESNWGPKTSNNKSVKIIFRNKLDHTYYQ